MSDLNIINKKSRLRFFLDEDKKRMSMVGMPTIKDWILHNEKWYILGIW